MDRSKAVELLTDVDLRQALMARRDVLSDELARIEEALGEKAEAPAPVVRKRRGGRPRKAQSGAPEKKVKPGRGAMKEHLAKVIGGKHGVPLVTGEIVDGLRQTFPEVYGEIETQVLAARVSACLTYNAKVFKCLGRGEGYVLADEGRAA